MQEFKITRQSQSSIEVEAVATGDTYTFVVMPLGEQSRALVHTIEGQGKDPLTKDMGEGYGRAKTFAEHAMLKAGAID